MNPLIYVVVIQFEYQIFSVAQQRSEQVILIIWFNNAALSIFSKNLSLNFRQSMVYSLSRLRGFQTTTGQFRFSFITAALLHYINC